MKTDIRVTKIKGGEYAIDVIEGDETTTHRVTLDDAYYHKLTDGAVSPNELIERSFRFLLEREPKESILPSFHLNVIQKYFPEYETTIQELV